MRPTRRDGPCECERPAPVREGTNGSDWFCGRCGATVVAPSEWTARVDELFERVRELKTPEACVRELGPPHRVYSQDDMELLRARAGAVDPTSTARAYPLPSYQAEWLVDGGTRVLSVQIDLAGGASWGTYERPPRTSA